MSWTRGLRRELVPHFEELVALAKRVDPSARVTSAKRSTAEQKRLYSRYLAGKSSFPAAPPGKSLHEAGRAIDIYAKDEVLRWLGAQWEAAGGKWGGRFKDPIHFEV